ncbi:maleylacetate reductase [Terrabacter sp. 2RAF25]|uniref:maleylacetate reductase n=1 Tax=Terrabacter sp. 2RAF25 TaxID=3232998 RepID=UPI003F96ACC4
MADPTTHPDDPRVMVHEGVATRVLIGSGALRRVPDELARVGAERVILVATRSASAPAADLSAALGSRLAARFDEAQVHTPVEVTDRALAVVTAHHADAVVALGGGSAVGLAKALTARTGIPQVAVPTTYAGSEVTPVLGETRGGVKTTRRDPALAPRTVVYDPTLTLSMPRGLTLTSGLNALAHAVEALWAPDRTPVSDALATESAKAIVEALPQVLSDLRDLTARARVQAGAWLAGMCLAQTRMGLHHQLAHTLGGSFDLPHAELHAMLLPHVMDFDLPAAPDAERRLERALGTDPVRVVRGLAAGHEGARRLRDLGVPRDALAGVAARVVDAPYPNPRPLDVESVTALLERAW